MRIKIIISMVLRSSKTNHRVRNFVLSIFNPKTNNMKTKMLYFLSVFLISVFSLRAQTSCSDIGRYVNSKNTNQTGLFTLDLGSEEEAAQTYSYSGPGVVNGVRVYGNFPLPVGGVPLAVSIYNVDAAGRPTTQLKTTNVIWWARENNSPGFIDVTFSDGGVYAAGNFAVAVRVRSAFPWGGTFRVGYTGDGEGLGEDLASIAGTSTGFNWTSAKNNFSKDGDFFIEPRITHFINSGFTVNNECIGVNQAVAFTNTTTVTKAPMFNTIFLPAYNGGQKLFTWNFGDGSALSNAENPSHTYTTAGVYTVTLTTKIDGWISDCSDIFTMRVSVGLTANSPVVSNVSCNGGTNGSIIASATGGSQPYSFSLTGGEGLYQQSPNFGNLSAGSYTLFVKDDVGCEKSVGFTVTQPSAITFTSAVPTSPNCGNNDGAITVSATGGTGTLQYKLNDGNYQAGVTFSNLGAGGYVVTAKDANNCTASITVGVVNTGSPSLTVLSTTNVSCKGGNDGSIVVIGSGGTGTLQYSLDGEDFASSGSFPNVAAGVYPVTVKDATGCTRVLVITITEPAALSVTASSTPVSCNGGNDGKIRIVSASGGIGTLTYSLNGTNYQSGINFLGLLAGTYTVYVKDVANCVATTTVTVEQPAAISILTATTNSSCFGSNNGSITVTASGGTGRYVYSLDGINYQPTRVFAELSAGNYTVYVKDGNNCVIVKLNVIITEPSQVAAAVTTGNSTCSNSNGSILVTGSGGSGLGYQYSADGINFNSTGLFSNLAAGTYYILVVDGSGCGRIVSATVQDSDGPSIAASTSTNVSCNGGNDGSITITSVTGGTGQITYSINGSSFQVSNVFTGLTAGNYTVVVKDANGCTGSIDKTITEPNPIVINTTTTDVTCFGASTGGINVVAVGSGTLAYSVDFGITYQSSNNFSGLEAGSYVVIVRDAGGCLGSKTVRINQPSKINISTGVLNVTCHGDGDGAIAVTSWGGAGNYQYSLGGSNYQSSNIFTNLNGGGYTVYVKDGSNCVQTYNTVVVEPAVLTVVSTLSDVSCAGGNNGVIDLAVSGGVAPYNFLWSNSSSAEDIFNLDAGDYAIYLSDANGCFFAEDFIIEEPSSPIIVNGVVTDATDSVSLNGGVDITVTGGVSGYTYSWSNGATTQDLENVGGGNYSVTVRDANGCLTSNSFTVAGYTGVLDLLNVKKAAKLYPNPASNFTIIETVGFEMSNVTILDITGKVVLESNPESSKEVINTTSLSNGTYFVKITVNNNVVTKKMEIVK